MAWEWAGPTSAVRLVATFWLHYSGFAKIFSQSIFPSISSVSLRPYFTLENSSLNSERPDSVTHSRSHAIFDGRRKSLLSSRCWFSDSWTLCKWERCLWIWDFRTSLTAPCKLLLNVLGIRNSGKWTFIIHLIRYDLLACLNYFQKFSIVSIHQGSVISLTNLISVQGIEFLLTVFKSTLSIVHSLQLQVL